ncbi:hypothetical protein BKA80DRAFT_272758, partial [Phyllosticta citrichinensis]
MGGATAPVVSSAAPSCLSLACLFQVPSVRRQSGVGIFAEVSQLAPDLSRHPFARRVGTSSSSHRFPGTRTRRHEHEQERARACARAHEQHGLQLHFGRAGWLFDMTESRRLRCSSPPRSWWWLGCVRMLEDQPAAVRLARLSISFKVQSNRVRAV